MRWKGGRKSQNVEDRRRAVTRGAAVGGGGLMLALLAALLLGQNPGKVLESMGGAAKQQQPQSAEQKAQDDELANFVGVILGDTEDVWNQVFQSSGLGYQEPKLVLYTQMTRTACGMGQAAAGPFYCPGDRQVYLDLSFLGELRKLGAPGDFAFAYVIAHEVGHHVQTLRGISDWMQQQKARMSKADGNQLQVRMELQADCYAGVWAHHADAQRQILESGDVEEGLRAAAAVGDDSLQKSAGRRVHPESWTHGSSEQRVAWFRQGLDSGDVNDCDTFADVM